MFNLIKEKVFLCLIFYIQISIAVESIPEDNQIDCNYTSSSDQWRESCNWCRCTETRRALCTRRGCPPALNTRLSEEKECKGDAQWKRDCNWCTCVEGRASCTASICENIEFPLGKSFARSANETECQMISNDASWRKECNWCKCDGGKQLCTRKLCHPDLEEKSEGNLDCNGEVKWKNGCERCECVNGHSVCSPESCKPNEDLLCKVKVKGSRFRDGCNWCACRNGRPICTKVGCKPDGPRIEGTPICEGEISWKKDCNWCRCVNGEAKCTENRCAKDTNCQDGESWVDGCNTCICTNGSSFCTRKACADHVTNEIQPFMLKHRAEELTTIASTFQSQSTLCTEGSQWMSGCNLCSCRNGLPICTLVDCSPENDSGKHPPCTEGSQWKEDCNICKCTNGIPTCIKEDCEDDKLFHQPESNTLLKSSGPIIDLKPSEDCTDGSRWKQECNWCNCMNGKGACTLMGCLRGFKDKGPECENGSVWRGSNCSICHCEEEKAVCEASPCITKRSGTSPEEGEKVNKILPHEKCTEESRWKVDCNWCSCSNGFGHCTEIHCMPGGDYSEEPQCINDSQWLTENGTWCFCDRERAICSPSKCEREKEEETTENNTEKETSAITTETPSLVSSSTKLAKEISSAPRNEKPLCSEGSRWVNRCNWCTCANGVGLCEQKACTSDAHKEMDKTCDGKSRWRDDCNWCKCENGKGKCTTKNCTEVTVNDPPVETCKAGSSWLEDCNICLCTNKTTVCTKKECKPSTRTPNALCSEEKVWKDDCNTCRCFRGEEACTGQSCPPIPRGPLPKICHLPAVKPDTELCGGFEARWTYNVKSEKCEPIVYGGCGGTDNLFTNEQECLMTCGNQQEEPHTDSEGDPKERCFMAVVPGPCFGQIVRFAFFPERKRCEKFYYGGCQGNQNNFVSLEECNSMCGGSPVSVGEPDEDIIVEA